MDEIENDEWQEIVNKEAVLCFPQTLKNAWGFICRVTKDETGKYPLEVTRPVVVKQICKEDCQKESVREASRKPQVFIEPSEFAKASGSIVGTRAEMVAGDTGKFFYGSVEQLFRWEFEAIRTLVFEGVEIAFHRSVVVGTVHLTHALGDALCGAEVSKSLRSVLRALVVVEDQTSL